MSDLDSLYDVCFLCEMRKFPPEKRLNNDFFYERKEEFYPSEQFGDYVACCEKCSDKLMEYIKYI